MYSEKKKHFITLISYNLKSTQSETKKKKRMFKKQHLRFIFALAILVIGYNDIFVYTIKKKKKKSSNLQAFVKQLCVVSLKT